MLKAIDKTYTDFYTGDVVVRESYGTTYAQKILKIVFVDEIAEYRYICLPGKVVDDKFVPYATGKDVALDFYDASSLRLDHANKWTPGEGYGAGDVLLDQNGDVYLVDSVTLIWDLKSGTSASAEYWAKIGRKLKLHKTAGGGKFSKHFTTVK